MPSSRAAIGVDRRGVGIDRVDLGVDVGNIVLARQQQRVEIGRHAGRERREIGAQVGDRMGAQAGDLARRVDRQFGVTEMVAAMRVGEERLGAVGRPFHRAVDFARRPDAHGLLGVDEDFRAEAAADIGRDDAQLVLGRDADEGRQHEARDMRVLAGGEQRQIIRARIIFADRRARLHRVGDQPVVDEVELGDVFGRGERRIGGGLVAKVPVVDGVVGGHFVDLRGARLGDGAKIHRRRQNAVIDDDFLRRLARLRISIGDDDGDVIADIAHLALRQHGMRPGLHRRTVLGMDHPAADEAADLVGGDVLAGEHGDDAGGGERGGRVDSVDRRMGVGRAQEMRISLSGAIDVIDITSLAGDETKIFLALDGGANAGRTHEVSPCGETAGPSRIANLCLALAPPCESRQRAFAALLLSGLRQRRRHFARALGD